MALVVYPRPFITACSLWMRAMWASGSVDVQLCSYMYRCAHWA